MRIEGFMASLLEDFTKFCNELFLCMFRKF